MTQKHRKGELKSKKIPGKECDMDSKENKLYYFIQLELLHLKNLTEIFGEEQSPRY